MKAPSKAVEAAFSRFWSAYPFRRDNPRAPALTVFARHVADGVDAEALIAAAGRYAAFCAAEKTPSLFIPHARKWLNQRYFDDYLTDDPASAQLEAAPAGPNPDHPLAALWAEVGPAAWASYFALLKFAPGDGATVITASTAYARDHLRREWGRRIVGLIGPVIWRP